MSEAIIGTEPWRSAAQTLADRHQVTVLKYRRAMTGYAAKDSRKIVTPQPRSAMSFAIFAHEVGHKALHSSNGSYPRWREEVEAWDFALAAFREFDLRRPRRVLHEATMRVRYSLGKAQRRSNDPEAILRSFRRDYPSWARRLDGLA